jgi:hypothetical protein
MAQHLEYCFMPTYVTYLNIDRAAELVPTPFREVAYMAKLSHPTNRQVPSPLLIDGKQLEALDEIIDRYEIRLRSLRDKVIEEATEREIQKRLKRRQLTEEQVEAERPRIREFTVSFSPRLNTESRSVKIYLTRGREIQAQRFSEAVNQPVGEQEVPVGFALFLTLGNVRASVRLRDELWRRELSVDAEPNELEVVQELFGALSNWASDVEAPRWQQKWLSARAWFGGILIFWLFFGLLFIPIVSWMSAGQHAARVEARKLLANGLNANNQQRALELLLAIESDYDYGARSSRLGIRYWSYVAIGTSALICAFICPQVCIGLWGGKQRLKRWRAWITAVAVTIPILLIGSAALPWLLYWLGLSPPNP